jgi:hypothetical protein
VNATKSKKATFASTGFGITGNLYNRFFGNKHAITATFDPNLDNYTKNNLTRL